MDKEGGAHSTPRPFCTHKIKIYSVFSLLFQSLIMATAASTTSRTPSLLSCTSKSLSIAPNHTKITFQSHQNGFLRREFLKGIALAPILWKQPPFSEAREVEVGSYLPPLPSDPSFVLFKATPKDTPALRAGKYAANCTDSLTCITSSHN